MQYKPSEIEPKWQERWERAKVYKTPESLKELGNKPKFYVLDMFPYPSGAGLHVGHPEGYTATDITARYKRMKGFNVLHPMGWDAFGLPAERSAVRENIHPAVITKRNVDNFRKQLKQIGFSYDWDREVDTTAPDYYKWTQWIFLQLNERGLAYLAEVPVNWCPALGTVLANEEVKDGRYVDTGDIVERRLMKQWMLKITEYAERLISDLDGLDWPENVKEMQRNWIGKSTGARVEFRVKNSSDAFHVFTTRPDTLFGATFCVLAPEHPLALKITGSAERAAVEKYIAVAKNKSDMARTDDSVNEKTGVFTGAYALNPANGKEIPIWIADYVLITYGTGAIMAVPGHDERDHAFAAKFGLDILEVVAGGTAPIKEKPFTENEAGKLVNSDFLNGLSAAAAKEKMISWLEGKKLGERQVQYKLRDWLFSRQRYWGEPFPMLHLQDGSVVPVPVEMLPVELPKIDEYKPTEDGRPPLARAGDQWLHLTLPDGRRGTRETNTMPQWAGSCWYYLRFLDARNKNKAWDAELEKYWMPVDLYVGGIEHAVLHLLYARFWHKVLFDCGLVSTKEPFQKLFNQGMILAYSYQNKAGKYFSPNDIRMDGSKAVHKETGEEMHMQVEKMSKSKYNVTNPDDVVAEYGADSLRLYEMFMGPLDQVKPWKTDGVDGVYRFLARVWRLVIDESTGGLSKKLTEEPGASQESLWKNLHRTIKKVGEDIEAMRFNTGISQMMIFVNEATGVEKMPREIIKIFLRLLSPYAPHIAEEIWERLGEKAFLVQQDWPSYDPALCEDDLATIVVMVNGKKRDEFSAPKAASDAELEKLARAQAKIVQALAEKPAKKVIIVPGKLVNFVV